MSSVKDNPSFIAVDWGTSSFRLWSLTDTGEILDHVSGPFGMSGLAREDYSSVLEDQLAKMGVEPDVPVVICGMAGAAQGWCEAPYVLAPTILSTLGSSAVRVPDTQRIIHILPGVMQQKPANVMRGEETQILGLLLARPGYEGSVCLPGTHSKWVQLRDGKIEYFTTCMTGELFALLSEQSVLKHSTSGGGWDTNAFIDAVEKTMETPETMANALFELRADMLLHSQSSATARARLSGMLIGWDLASTQALWTETPIVLIGDSTLCQNYLVALKTQSVSAEILGSETMTLGGLIAAYRQI